MADNFVIKSGSPSGSEVLSIPRGSLRMKASITDADEDSIPGDTDPEYWDMGTRRRILTVSGRLSSSDEAIDAYMGKLDSLLDNQYDDDNTMYLLAYVEDAYREYEGVILDVEWTYPPGQTNTLEYSITFLRVSSYLSI